MALRKASVYKPLERPYTRTSKVKSKSYIKTTPPKKIVKYVMGDTRKQAKGGFNYEVTLVCKKGVQLRDNSLEAARQIINRHLEISCGTDFYFLITTYPHHILREHKIAAVAQSDRFFSGMSHAFGKTVSNAAQIHTGHSVFKIEVMTENQVALVRKFYHMALSKLGMEARIDVRKLK